VQKDNNNIINNYQNFEIIDKNENSKIQIKNEKPNQITNLNNNDKELSDEEILKCKENGFILIGKTGVGKTSLLNVIFGEEKGKVGYTSKQKQTLLIIIVQKKK
jgi:putative ribosome biogenesis GTPase RsgA